MTTPENISVYIGREDKKLIDEASKKVSLNKSAFCRTYAVIKAREILQLNNY